MSDKIINRILQEAQVPELMETLENRLSLTDLQSLLLEVYRKRTNNLTPRDVFEQYNQNRFVQPAQVSPKDILEFDSLAYSLLPPDFESVELSPVCPLGTVSVLATVDQNNTLTTVRNTEVCSDSTNMLALECARRRRSIQSNKARARERIKLCSSHRLLRSQAFEEPGTYPHFRLFGLCTSGRDEGSFIFETEALVEHIDYYIRLLMKARDLDLKTKALRVIFLVFDEDILKALSKKVHDPLSERYENVEYKIDQNCKEGYGYYLKVRFQIYVRDQDDTDYFLVDGGFTDWTQKCLSNRKERLLISGLGSERLLTCFK